MPADPWDVIVVGGGPAGLSGALWLARYRHSVLLLDDDRPRNRAAWAVHGYPGLPDTDPTDLRERIRDQALEAGAHFEPARITAIHGEKGRFTVEDENGTRRTARRLLLAYGRQDRVPELEGLREQYGRSVFHCPDCDGPSVVGRTVAVLGTDREAARLALYLLTWAERTLVLTDGRELEIEDRSRETLDRHGVDVIEQAVRRLEAGDDRLSGARLDDGSLTAFDALFFHWGSDPTSALGPAAGCACDRDGRIRVDAATLESSVPGVHAAGDIVGRPYLAASAAAEGVTAALAIHRSLLPPEFEL